MKDLGVEEVRKARHRISEECGHNLHRVVAYYKEVEEELRRSGKYKFEETSRDQHEWRSEKHKTAAG